jgi:hypothetical protein
MIPNVFDCQAFHELCMDYRGAVLPDHAQGAYERLQAYCSNALSDLHNRIAEAAEVMSREADDMDLYTPFGGNKLRVARETLLGPK